MKVFRKDNVLEAAKARIEWIFSEFEDVCVSWSGGKDSTVILHLTLEIAEKLGRLPVPVLWIDQEAEWGSVVRLAREVFTDPRVKPYWLQVPIQLFNSTNHADEWLQCWEPGVEWMRPKEEFSIHENVYGTKTFGDMFNAFFRHHFDGPVANIGGVRAEESPSRAVGLTHNPTYKWVTWGKILDKRRQQFSLYPIYDWSYADVWKAIHDHGWKYSDIYDKQYAAGVAVHEMRVSNLHHQTAVKNLLYAHEVEADTWAALQKRLGGVNGFRHLGKNALQVRVLPPMFKDWREYRDYLLENLIQDPVRRETFRDQFASNDEEFKALDESWRERLNRTETNAILLNDWHMVKVKDALNSTSNPFLSLRRAVRGVKIKGKAHEQLTRFCPEYAAGRIGPGKAGGSGEDPASDP